MPAPDPWPFDTAEEAARFARNVIAATVVLLFASVALIGAGAAFVVRVWG